LFTESYDNTTIQSPPNTIKYNVHDIKNHALDLHNKWKKLMKTTFISKGVDPNKIVLESDDILKVTKIDENKLMSLIDESHKLNDEIIFLLEKNEWIGWIFLSFAKHLQEETNYFKNKITGQQMTAKDEIAYINHHHMTEMGVTEKMIDPSPANDALAAKIKIFSEGKIQKINNNDVILLNNLDNDEIQSMLNLSLKYSKELVAFAKETGAKIDNKQLKSIINPVIAHHIEREFERFTYVLETLGAK